MFFDCIDIICAFSPRGGYFKVKKKKKRNHDTCDVRRKLNRVSRARRSRSSHLASRSFYSSTNAAVCACVCA